MRMVADTITTSDTKILYSTTDKYINIYLYKVVKCDLMPYGH